MTNKCFVAPGIAPDCEKGAASLVWGQWLRAGLTCLPLCSDTVLGKKKDFPRALTFQEGGKEQELNRGLQNSTVVKRLCSGLRQTWAQVLRPLSLAV